VTEKILDDIVGEGRTPGPRNFTDVRAGSHSHQEFWREYAQNDPEQHLCGFVGRLVGMSDAAQEEQEGHLFAEVRRVSVSAELASALCCIDEDAEAAWNGHEHSRIVLVVRVGALLKREQ
jgi:hypothetical protein